MAGEEELGASIPTVLKKNVSWVILNVLEIYRDSDYGLLHRTEGLKKEKQIYRNLYQYVPVCTGTHRSDSSMYYYVLDIE